MSGYKISIEEKIKRMKKMEGEVKKINLRDSLQHECIPLLVKTFRGRFEGVEKTNNGELCFCFVIKKKEAGERSFVSSRREWKRLA